LCGQVHPLRVHSYPWRRYRDRDSGENVRIRVVSVLCPRAHAGGKPYTKRLLPDFLIPHCVIRLDHLIDAAHEQDLEQTCEILGCLDIRTARKHLKRLESAARAAALTLAESAVTTPELGTLPTVDPSASSFARLLSLFEREQQATIRSGELTAAPTLRQLIQATLGKPGGNKPSSFASDRARPP